MNILFSPQIPVKGNKIFYEFEDDKVSIKMMFEGELYEDFFDFEGLPNGELELTGENGEDLVDVDLPVNPLKEAKKVDGVLYVTLLNWIGVEATEEENYPDWMASKDYEDYLKRVTPPGDYFNLKGYTPTVGDGVVGLMVILPIPGETNKGEGLENGET